MIRVVVVGKTHMGKNPPGYCIGALRLRGWAAYRLKAPGGAYSWPTNCGIDIGDILEVEGKRPTETRNPHTEDFIVETYRIVGRYDSSLADDIYDNCQVAENLSDLFERCITELGTDKLGIDADDVPNFSTQFWVPKNPLTLEWQQYQNEPKKPYYRYRRWVIPYKGVDEPIETIPAGSLVRLSLAQWFPPEAPKCYLQLSGWFLPTEDED